MSAKMHTGSQRTAQINLEQRSSSKAVRLPLQHRDEGSTASVIRSILVPIDFSPESLHALKVAVQFGQTLGATLTLLHVDETVSLRDFSTSHPMALDKDQIIARRVRDLQKTLVEMNVQPGVIRKILVRQGRAYHEITESARELKADLIILSTHGYKGLKHLLLGSTAERVVQHAPCSVFVVRNNEPQSVFKS